LRGHAAITNFDISSYTDYLQQLEQPIPKAQPKPALKPKAEPVDEEAPLLLPKAGDPIPEPLLTPKPEPEDELAGPLAPLPPGPVLRDADDVDHAIAVILPALCMDPADFEARYPARRARALGWPSDDHQLLRGLPLPDDVGFEDDIETLFEALGSAGPGQGGEVQPPAAVSCAAAAISSLASGRWW